MNLADYLKHATRGLPSAQRDAVRSELHNHVFERVRTLELGGMPQDKATTQAIHELGPPAATAQALRRIHQVHPAFNAVVLTGVLGLAWLGWQFNATAQLTRSLQAAPPQITWATGQGDPLPPHAFLAPELRNVFAGTHVNLEGQRYDAQLTLDGFAPLSLEQMRMKVARKDGTFSDEYYLLDSALEAAVAAGWPLEIKGHGAQTQVLIGGAPLQFSGSEHLVTTLLLKKVGLNLGNPDSTELSDLNLPAEWNQLAKGRKAMLKITGLTPKRNYVLVVHEDPRLNPLAASPPPFMIMSFTPYGFAGQADASGTLELHILSYKSAKSGEVMPHLARQLQLVDSLKQWNKTRANQALLWEVEPHLTQPPRLVPRRERLTLEKIE